MGYSASLNSSSHSSASAATKAASTPGSVCCGWLRLVGLIGWRAGDLVGGGGSSGRRRSWLTDVQEVFVGVGQRGHEEGGGRRKP